MDQKSYFAPAKRSTPREIREDSDLVASHENFIEIFSSIPGIGAVINENRQIIHANPEFLAFLDLETEEPVLGKRPGEAMSCIHSEKEPFGCGTAEACNFCGAVDAILESQDSGLKSKKETRLSIQVNGKLKSLDFNISSTSITLNGKVFYLLFLQDISNEKRRSALERIFFHDLLNTAGGLNGLLGILKQGPSPEEAGELISLSEEASRHIIEEIILQRQIREAETGDLKLKIELVNSIELLASAIGKINSHTAGKNKTIVIDNDSAAPEFETDILLLQRVIINLLKNALESTPYSGTVVTGIEDLGNMIRFWVKNDEIMSQDVQLQLFQRSFSTKGEGRGIGTYSIKMLTENYLKGKVSFISNEIDSTVFSVELYKKFPAD
jgi:signal transduction histidine kinase